MKASEQLALYRRGHVIRATEPGPGGQFCKFDSIKVIQRRSGHLPLLFRHDPDAIKALVEAAAVEPTGLDVSPLDMAIDHLKELGVHEFEGRSDRGCTRCLKPDRSIWHLRGYVDLANLVNAGTIKRRPS